MGLPLNMKGKDTGQTRIAREFVDALKGRFGLPVIIVDERLSSVSAGIALKKKGVKSGHNKGEVDKTAAAIILQEYLDGRM